MIMPFKFRIDVKVLLSNLTIVSMLRPVGLPNKLKPMDYLPLDIG